MSQQPPSPVHSIKRSVVIIGAGIAGLQAASELYHNGVKDVIILEARNRIGGRLLTMNSSSLIDPSTNKPVTYDLGATWFHDTLQNPLFDEYVINRKKIDIYYDDSFIKIFNSKGEIPDSWKLPQVKNEIEKFMELENFNDIDYEDKSLFNSCIDYLYKQKSVLTKEQITYTPELLRYLELWHGLDWKRLSSKFAIISADGRNAYNLNGYQDIIQDIISDLPNDTIQTNIIIKKIQKVDQNRKVRVLTNNNIEIIADYVIVTIPQSLLSLSETNETGAISFSPPLPPYIEKPLSRMHFGSLGKVIIEFNSIEDIFWDKETDRFLVIADPDPKIKEFSKEVQSANEKKSNFVIKPDYEVEDYDLYKNKIPKQWEYPINISNGYTIKKSPFLLCITQSPLTEFLEAAPLDVVWEYLKPMIYVLAEKNPNITSIDKLPTPVQIRKTFWSQDPFARGSYAGCFAGDDPTDLIIGLTKGFGHVRFAGEHTIMEGAGCVHGAWLSGKREANYILSKLGLLTDDNINW
ncbi:polyamine oxidase [Ascoidea rubescens DSM 1968]|uniref:Amine oxidase n=1 Tax=Ascoidea rubescens DSM 1968 TaxID=1344418 RepID=A0A1D2VIW8_9ASCO|nr:amine oxidase [Ascoidea rubescens DSM 1968]ODV61574.1 amine oxidase [Ascoidea rubescens DSM 1968]